MARRATQIKQLQKQNPNSLVVDVGIWGSRMDVDPNREARSVTNVKCMSAMGYQGAGVSPQDFRFGKSHVLEAKRAAEFPLLACNLVDRADGKPLVDGSTVVRAGEMKIGLIGVSTREDLSLLKPGGKRESDPAIQRQLEEVNVLDPNDSVKREIARLPRDLSLIVVLSSLPAAGNVSLAQANPEIDLILTSQEITELVKPPDWENLPPAQRRLQRYHVAGSTYIIYGGETVIGQLLGSIRLNVANGKVTSADVNWSPLGDNIPEDPAVRAICWEFYRGAIEKMGVPAGEKRLAWASPENDPRAKYVGAERCGQCHQTEFKHWHDKTRHVGAWLNLLQRYNHFWPQCASCHTTGYGHESGFNVKEMTPGLRNVQCESCHGPGSVHAAEPKPANIRGKPTRKHCEDCHAGPLPQDCSRMPNRIGEFDQDFDAFWRAVSHKQQ